MIGIGGEIQGENFGDERTGLLHLARVSRDPDLNNRRIRNRRIWNVEIRKIENKQKKIVLALEKIQVVKRALSEDFRATKIKIKIKIFNLKLIY
jgi:hypothetical protein